MLIAVDNAYEDDQIIFTLRPKEGYVLRKLTITTESGKKISYEKESIIDNEDGTITINKFIMPDEDVLIEAEWSDDIITKVVDKFIVNPDTGDKIIITLILFMISLCCIIII